MDKQKIKPNTRMHPLSLILKGVAMGIAEVIPGVSGGTIAFISGVYERLISSIKKITSLPGSPRLIWQPKKLWTHIDGAFLIKLLGGMIGGLAVGVFVVSYLLEHYPEPLWGFFFGLILASIMYLLQAIKPLDLGNYLSVFMGAFVAIVIVSITPSQGSESLVAVFGAGAIAICALILPGISGSFILLLMGMYSIVIPAVKDVISLKDLDKGSLVVVFGLGCLVGLSLFARLIDWLLQRHRNNTLAMMIGFMLGSLVKIWPWRNPVLLMDRSSLSIQEWSKSLYDQSQITDFRVLLEKNVLPADYWGDAGTVYVIPAFLLGLLAVYFLSRLDRRDTLT